MLYDRPNGLVYRAAFTRVDVRCFSGRGLQSLSESRTKLKFQSEVEGVLSGQNKPRVLRPGTRGDKEKQPTCDWRLLPLAGGCHGLGLLQRKPRFCSGFRTRARLVRYRTIPVRKCGSGEYTSCIETSAVPARLSGSSLAF
jgi:hypothetical protein